MFLNVFGVLVDIVRIPVENIVKDIILLLCTENECDKLGCRRLFGLYRYDTRRIVPLSGDT